MFIKSIRLKNFKNFEDNFFEFKNKNVLKGKNGSGKSAIKEAIIFALYNRTSDGSKDTDRYIAKEKDFCEVELVTEKHTYLRKRSKSQTDFKLDGKVSPQKNNKTPFEIFNSVFNLGYFMNLDDKTQRNLILQNTPKIDKMELFEGQGGKKVWLENPESLDNLQENIKFTNSRKLQKTKERNKNKAILEYLEKFPYDKLKFSNSTLAKLKKVMEKETSKISLAHDTGKHMIAELQHNYRILVKLPNLEMRAKLKNLLVKLRKEFKAVNIVLSELYKSEMGRKDVFKFFINDIEYKNLSSGEKLRFDLVISKFFNSLLKESIDCFFFDDIALLDEDLEIPRQSFVAMIWPFSLEVQSM